MKYNNVMQSSRIRLRSMEINDVELLYEWENDTDNWIVSGTQRPYSKNELRQFIELSSYDVYTSKQLRFVVESLELNRSVGLLDLFDFNPNNRRIEVGILIDKQYRQHGFAGDALQLAIDYSFQVLNVNQVYANVTTDNFASRKLFESHGFEKCGLKKQWIRTPNGWLDEVMYQLLQK